MKTRKVLVTGAAGFIGAFLVKRLLDESDDVIIGLDNLNSYYDPGIKDARLNMLAEADTDGRFTFVRGDLCDAALIERLFEENCFDVVVNLAAQAGVRYSIENPRAYLESNLVGFFNILEACRHHPVRHLVYASSSSVYGGNKKVPFSEEDRVDSPVSLYAATKKSNELMAAAYSKLYSIPATGLRFFTVYGPMGRPDMAYFGFTEKLRRGDTIKIFNMGDCRRDFTYVDDIVEGVRRVMDAAPRGEDGRGRAAPRRAPRLQHRQLSSREPARLRRHAATRAGGGGRAACGLRLRGPQAARAHAAGRRARHLRRYHGAPARPGLQARDATRGRPEGLCQVV